MNSIRIPDVLFRRIAVHGEQTYPEECCGVMLGKGLAGERVVQETIEIDNSQDENRRRRFLITPEQYRKAERQAADRKMELLGFYHSHPDHPAVPSAFDTDHAFPWFAYVIVSVVKGKADRTTAWVLEENRSRFAECALVIGVRAEQISTLK